jgi:hypothetical protein
MFVMVDDHGLMLKGLGLILCTMKKSFVKL